MSDYDFTLKFIIVGEASVGKTVLTKRYIKNEFLSDTLPTIGNDYFKMEKDIGEFKVLIQFWDTAGQERYKSVAKKIYEDARAIMIVYDITNKMSFMKVDEWFKSVNNTAKEGATKILVGNKIDLQSDRQVSAEEGKDKALALGMLFMETSAKTNEGGCVNSAFDQIIAIVSKEMIKEIEEERKKERESTFQSIIKIEGANESESKSCC